MFNFSLLSLLALLIACEDSKQISDSSSLSYDSEITDEITGTPSFSINGMISGDINVQLYQTGEDGEREYVSWEDATGGVYIFGGIFTSAYYVDESGIERFVGDHVIENPSTDANPYRIDVGTDNNEKVYVYSILDYWQDRIVGTSEPKGVYPNGVTLIDGEEITGINLDILTPIYTGSGGCGSSGDWAGGSVSSSSYIEILGDAYITTSYAGGMAAAMLNSTTGDGPYNSAWFQPSSAGGGAIGSYGFITCPNRGEMNLVAAWDSNGNNMIDPTDRWGAYSPTPDVDGNPVMIVSDDLLGYDIQIPLGDGPGLNMVPFIRLSGELSTSIGAFDDLPSGTTIHIAAMKYRPSGALSVAELGNAYDLVTLEWPELTGQASVSYTLTVPSNTITYLWAFVDMDDDGVINESGEPIASGGDSSGKVPTGTTSTTSNDLSLQTANE